MNCVMLPLIRNVVSATLILISLSATTAWAQTYKVLHQFNPNNGDGYFPEGGVVFDRQGNLYGTTGDGGLETCLAQGCGTVWELTPDPDGSWTENLIHKFDGSDGAFPANFLVFDTQGNLYGTASTRGSYSLGAIFELTPSGGIWTESTLHQFTGGWDGAGNPGSELSIDNGGHIYGSTASGGAYGEGVVFALAEPESGEIVLHAFTGGADGATPLGPLTFDASGNIYGTAAAGGSGYGLVFKLTPNKFNAGWTETVLYTFAYQDRIQPSGGVIFDAAGNLYGATAYGGARNLGAVYKLTHQADDSWGPSLLYSFAGPPDGEEAYTPLIFDNAGNLYGTTNGGGPLLDGTVFKLTPGSGGQWTETILYGFSGGADGGAPLYGVIRDSAGNLYGTTPLGGIVPRGYGGVVFEITP
jgi:uncharacterized repeat protein (TIGR03803 family)